MEILELGEMAGPLIVFGGPYSNLHALEALLGVAAGRDVPGRSLISTGDLVAYCADPAAVVARVRELGIHVVAGNCEKQIAAGAADCGCGFEAGSACDALSGAWYAHVLRSLDDDARAFLGACPDRIGFIAGGRRFVVLHGGASAINAFLWPVTEEEIFEAEWDLVEREMGPVDVILAGHAGIPFRRTLRRGDWINAGALGLPANNGTRDVTYAVIENGNLTFETLGYDAEGAAKAMAEAGLRQGYDRALTSGWWPSEDVLPDDLRRGS